MYSLVVKSFAALRLRRACNDDSARRTPALWGTDNVFFTTTDPQNESQVQECLGNVIQMQSSRNVAARVYTAHDIHPNISACDRASVNLTEDGNDDVDFEEMVIHDVGGAEAGECEESVGSVLAALCRFNHVALT